MEKSVIHIRVALSMRMPLLCGAALGAQCGPQAGLCCMNPMVAGQTQPAHGNRGAPGQLPVGTCNYTTCVALPLFDCEQGVIM